MSLVRKHPGQQQSLALRRVEDPLSVCEPYLYSRAAVRCNATDVRKCLAYAMRRQFEYV